MSKRVGKRGNRRPPGCSASVGWHASSGRHMGNCSRCQCEPGGRTDPECSGSSVSVAHVGGIPTNSERTAPCRCQSATAASASTTRRRRSSGFRSARAPRVPLQEWRTGKLHGLFPKTPHAGQLDHPSSERPSFRITRRPSESFRAPRLIRVKPSPVAGTTRHEPGHVLAGWGGGPWR
jgi:hypothetical protein